MTAPPAPGHNRREGISLGRLWGIPLVLAWSWFVIALFIVLVFGPEVARAYPEIGFGAYGVALGYALLLAASVLVHELAHALSARLFGWPTARIVLNLWGGHTQFGTINATPGRSLIVSLAGPAANLLLALGGWLIVDAFEPFTVGRLLADIFIWANVLVAVFNLLPGLPLDGGSIVESAVWKATGNHYKGTVAAGWAGRIVVIGLVAVVLGVPLLAGAAPNMLLVVITAVVGASLWMGATAAIRDAQMRLRLPEISAGRLKQPALGIAAGSSVQTVRRLIRDNPGAAVILTGADHRPEAVVDIAALVSVPDAGADATPVNAVARALAPGAMVLESAQGQELVQFLAKLPGSEYAVLNRQGQVTGLLHQSTVVAAITGKPLGGTPGPGYTP